jgi:hypothetical protein
MNFAADDDEGRRSGIERRQFSYMIHIPERRSGEDRRSGVDRRTQKSVKLEPAQERRRVYAAGLIR